MVQKGLIHLKRKQPANQPTKSPLCSKYRFTSLKKTFYQKHTVQAIIITVCI